MREPGWIEEFPAAVTVCDRRGRIVEMNRKAGEAFSRQGGSALIGASVLACHPPRARAKLARLLRSGRTNAYTIEKKGKRKLIYQAAWRQDDKLAGLVELSIELPRKLPHFVREG